MVDGSGNHYLCCMVASIYWQNSGLYLTATIRTEIRTAHAMACEQK